MKVSHNPATQERMNERTREHRPVAILRFFGCSSRLCALLAYFVLCSSCGSALKRATEPATHGDSSTAVRFLTSEQCRGILVEADYVSGCRPSKRAVSALREVLAKYCDKPDGVEVLVDSEVCDFKRDARISNAECARLRERYESLAADGQTAKLYVLVVPFLADYEHRQKGSRGWCKGNFIVIAREELRRYVILHITLPKIEEFVLIHEAGHTLGLVANSAHEYRNHCTNPACVMYYDLDMWALLANLASGLAGKLPTAFCAECEADLKALRGMTKDEKDDAGSEKRN